MSRYTTSIPERIASRMPRLKGMAEELQAADRITKSAAKDFNTILSGQIREEWSIVVNGLYALDTEASREIIFSTTPTAKNMDKREGQLKKLLKKFPDDAELINRVMGQTQEIADKYRAELDLVPVFQDKALASQKAKEKERELESRPIEEKVPMATRSTIKKVDAVIREHTRALEDKVREQTLERLQRYVSDFQDRAAEKTITNLDKEFGRYAGHSFYLKRLTQRDGVASPRSPLILMPDVKERMEKIAKNEAYDIVEKFRIKTIQKLSTVSEGFGELVEIGMNTMIHGAVEGHISVKFSDQTSFDVRSQLVTSTGPSGAPFTRYPTTFHNVRQPGQPTQKMVSQLELSKISNAKVESKGLSR